MQLSSFLNAKLICLQKNYDSSEQIIEALIQKIVQFYRPPLNEQQIYKAIMQREAQSSTVYPTGIAIPHTRLENFNDTIIAICIPKKPIPTDSSPIRMVTLILTNKASSKLYLNMVEAFLSFSKQQDSFSQACSISDPDKLIAYIQDLGLLVKQEITAQDLIDPNFICIQETATLAALGDLFTKNNLTYCPVVNEEGVLVGEATVQDCLKVGLPNYYMLLDNMSFLSSLEPFEKLLEREDSIQVKAIMRPVSYTLDAEDSVIEAAYVLVQNHRHFIPVLSNKRLIGVLSSLDVYRKVIRG